MAYVEYLRVRRLFGWYILILAALVLLALYFGQISTVEVQGSTKRLAGMAVPLGALVPIGMFFAAIFSSSVGSSLNRENQTRDLSWTKPLSRSLIALQFLVIDIAAVLLLFACAMLGVVLVLMRMQMVPVLGPDFVWYVILGAGVALMWYGLVQALTAWSPPGARSIPGLLWPVCLLLLALAHAPGSIGAISRAIDVVNPLSYMSGVQFSAQGAAQEVVSTLPLELRVPVVCLFALLFCAIAVYVWPRREA